MSTLPHVLRSWLRQYPEVTLPCRRTFGNRRLLLRQLEPGDAGHLQEFVASHTPETIRSRYGYALSQLSPDEVARRVAVNQLRDAALGAFERDEAGSHLVAIARYCLSDDEQSAELAFVVREDSRCLGIATTLLHALMQIGRGRGVRHFTAWVQHDNPAMLDVFRSVGAEFRGAGSGDGVDVKISLRPWRERLVAHWTPEILRSAPARLRGAAARAWLRVENASAHLLGNYPLP